MASFEEFDVFAIFNEEASDHIQSITDGLLLLEKDPANAEVLKNSMRAAHTLKGAARAIQFTSVKELAHHLEDIFNRAQINELRITSAMTNQLLAAMDLIQQLVLKAEASKIQEMSPEIETMLECLTLMRDHPEEPEKWLVSSTEPPAETPLPPDSSVVSLPDQNNAPKVFNPQGTMMFQVQASALDRMLQQTGELKVTQQLSDELINQFKRYLEKSMRLSSQIDTLSYYHNGEMIQDRVAIKSALSQTRNAQRELQEALSQGMREMEHLTNQLFHTSNNLDEEVVNARLKTLADIIGEFPRMVRDLAQEHEKQVEFQIKGEDVKIDKAVLDVIRIPLLHLLRNAVAHGIESPAVREQRGKPASGQILVSARQSKGQIFIEVRDDGQGIDSAGILQKVIERGDLTEETAAKLSPDELRQFLFLPGFSTAAELTDLSGRGVGLDIVKSEVEAIGGNTRVQSELEKFTVFSLEFPATISLTPVLAVAGGISDLFGQQIYLIPVNQIATLHPDNVQNTLMVEDRQMFEFNGQVIPFCQLSTLFQLQATPASRTKKTMIVLGTAGQYAGLLVENILHEENVIVQPCESRLGKSQDISGTATMRNGKGALVLDVHDLLNTIKEMSHTRVEAQHEKTEMMDSSSSILLVEDSATVRELMKQMLVVNGYQVVIAVDGQDGLNKFEQAPVDLVISDIDMPRMNGFEMVRKIRQSKKNADVSILMLSYKEREQDKQEAFKVGANDYLTKADFDKGVILGTIERLISSHPSVPV